MNNILKYKRIVIFAIVLLICGIYSYFVLTPQLSQISRLRQDIKVLKEQYDVSSSYEERLSDIDNLEKNLTERLEVVRSAYPSKLLQNDIIGLLSILSDVSGVSFKSISIFEAKEIVKAENPGAISGVTDPRVSSLALKLGILDSNLKNNPKLAVIPNGSGYVIEVKLETSGTSEQYMQLFRSIQDIDSRILINSFVVSNKNNSLEGVINMEFLGVMDSSASFEGFGDAYTWSPVDNENKSNLFEDYKGNKTTINNKTTITGATITKKTQATSYDFAMRVVPYGKEMAPATVSLSAKNLINSKVSPLIYGDNKETETINLYIKEAKGRYYCKYKTEKEMFPESTYTEMAEFKPLGRELVFLIDSTRRAYNDDKAGALVKIYNNTSKRLVVSILNDDKAAPRVIVEQQQGDIKVEYK